MVIVIETEDFFKIKNDRMEGKRLWDEIENSQQLLYFLRSLNLRQW